MGEHTRKPRGASENGRSHLGELIHAAVRGAIEAAVEAELATTLGAGRYERRDSRQGYRNGTKYWRATAPQPTMASRIMSGDRSSSLRASGHDEAAVRGPCTMLPSVRYRRGRG